ncbi:phosphoenolpyruvate--protein phosphotransferase [Kineosporia sp. R_H_3]|uniref:phosphoenolpyruvate--protein phosphotransferase n=1 Tax=Kineosporia sp. R_H_3 TaxID=1961848 RepID=UPI000B4A95F6|nr:phosphoenolpyruvate--protein phosphotransferase [Kineosporia sp. R_H_3]
MRDIQGVGVSAGLVVAPVRRMPDPVREPDAGVVLPEDERAAAAARLVVAADAVRADLEHRAESASETGRAVLEATALMAADPTLEATATGLVTDAGLTPERAIWQAANDVAAMLASLGGYMAERSRDVEDVRDRIVAELTGRPAPGIPHSDVPFVLVAHDLAPADTATIDTAVVRALVTVEGGPTSHTAILARALGLPAVVAAKDAASLADGDVVLVDGAAGRVVVDPDDAARARAERLAATGPRSFDGRGRTASGTPVALLANVGDGAGAVAAAAAGAEGVGLFRTEFCFLDRTEPPTVEEQVAAYRGVLEQFAGKKVVVRTLDAGSDKPLPFVTATDEPNPALGVRGLRTVYRAPQLLEDQLAAIAAAAGQTEAEVWVMAPMIATVDATQAFVSRCHAHGLQTAGVMVEIPSAAICADEILTEAAFASIGTNDLTQYTLAADRLLGDLAPLNDPWQPALLRLVDMTCRAGERRGRPVGVCGEAAADPALACVLVGLGVDSLSMTARSIADVAAALAGATDEQCRDAARAAASSPTAAQARAAAREHLPHLADLGL